MSDQTHLGRDGTLGGLWDRETGLVRFGARDYDPGIGRWTAKDPIGFAAGDGNLYGYAGGDAVVEYGLDPVGRRISRAVDGATHYYLYRSDLAVVATLDADRRLVQRYTYATASHVPDVLTTYDPSTGAETARYRYVTDVRGSVRLVVDADTGAVAQRLDYEAHGEVVFEWRAPGFDQPFGYAGGLWDRETGFVRFGARDYDPEIGRWTAKDPIGFAAGDGNLYGYVGGDPVNGVDPSGLYNWASTPSGVYRCRQRLGGTLGAVGFRHHWIVAKIGGNRHEYGWNLADVGYMTDQTGFHPEDPYRSTQPEVYCDHYPEADPYCVLEAVRDYEGIYFPFVNDCRQAASRVLARCSP